MGLGHCPQILVTPKRRSSEGQERDVDVKRGRTRRGQAVKTRLLEGKRNKREEGGRQDCAGRVFADEK